MSKDELLELIKILRENGVTEYCDSEITLKLTLQPSPPIQPSARPSRETALQRRDRIRAEELGLV